MSDNHGKTLMSHMTRMMLLALPLFGATVPVWAGKWAVSPQLIQVAHAQGTMTAYQFTPEGRGPFAVVIMMHGCAGAYSYSNPKNGLSSLHREWGDRIVAEGYAAILVDSFSFRNAPQRQCGNGNEGTSEVTERPFDIEAAYHHIVADFNLDPENVALLGWSHGASSILSALAQGHLNVPPQAFRSAVTFYPGCGLHNAFGGIESSTWVPDAPLLILHAGKDRLYKSGYCQQRIQNAVEFGAAPENGNGIGLIVYRDANHSFDYKSSSKSMPDIAAKRAADSEALAMFEAWFACDNAMQCGYLPNEGFVANLGGRRMLSVSDRSLRRVGMLGQ